VNGELTAWLIPGAYALLDLTAFIVAVVFFRRARAACTLVILAVAINLLTAIVREWGLDFLSAEEMWRLQSLVLRGTWFVGCITYGMILLAVFLGRSAPSRPDAESHRLT
jgi:hypothetical protein